MDSKFDHEASDAGLQKPDEGGSADSDVNPILGEEMMPGAESPLEDLGLGAVEPDESDAEYSFDPFTHPEGQRTVQEGPETLDLGLGAADPILGEEVFEAMPGLPRQAVPIPIPEPITVPERAAIPSESSAGHSVAKAAISDGYRSTTSPWLGFYELAWVLLIAFLLVYNSEAEIQIGISLFPRLLWGSILWGALGSVLGALSQIVGARWLTISSVERKPLEYLLAPVLGAGLGAILFLLTWASVGALTGAQDLRSPDLIYAFAWLAGFLFSLVGSRIRFVSRDYRDDYDE